SRRALPRADGDLKPGLLADVGLFARVRRARCDVPEDGDDALGIDAAVEVRGGLSVRPLRLVQLEQDGDGIGPPASHDLHHLTPEPRACRVDPAAVLLK